MLCFSHARLPIHLRRIIPLNNLLGLSNEDVISGLKEALNVAASKSAGQLASPDGFFKNAAVKILMPPDAVKVEERLREMGFGAQVDQAILSMNRAAEAASKKAAPIFLDAIKNMTVKDATTIVTGNDSAATHYLRVTTSPQLTAAFKPVVQHALDSTNATKYWNDVFSTYNKIPFVKHVNPDLTDYVTDRGLEGLYYVMKQEEAQIRKDPVGTANSLIEKVFGGK